MAINPPVQEETKHAEIQGGFKISKVFGALGLYATFPLNYVFGFGLGGGGLSKIFGRVIKTGILILGANQVAQQSTGWLFPDVTTYLKDRGYAEEVISDFQGENIRVRMREGFGMLHTLNDLPPLMNIVVNHDTLMNDARAS